MNIVGTWYIYEMELWGSDYFNMETQAFIKFDSEYRGEFQFGLVVGSFNGRVTEYGDVDRLEFLWEGADENDYASGGGWIEKEKDYIKCEISFRDGDCSTFVAKSNLHSFEMLKKESNQNSAYELGSGFLGKYSSGSW